MFLALSASSPFWHGLDTGMASARTKIFEGLPTAGLPPQLDSYGDFETFMETLIAANAIESVREVWWDVRPHPDFGTVELRMCDAHGEPDRGGRGRRAGPDAWCTRSTRSTTPARHSVGARDWVIRENKWLAARYGLDAEIIVDNRGTLRPVRAVIDELLTELAPTAAESGCSSELEDVGVILEHGPGYVRQRRVIDRGGTLVDVVDHLIEELRAGRPLP